MALVLTVGVGGVRADADTLTSTYGEDLVEMSHRVSVHLDDRDDVPIPFRWFQGSGHWSNPEALRAEMKRAGYRRVKAIDFLPMQSFQIFAPGEEGA